MKKMFLFICLMVTLAACERDAENKAESSLVGTTWTREYTTSRYQAGTHSFIEYTARDYVVFESATEMLYKNGGEGHYSERYRYTLDGTDLTLESVKIISTDPFLSPKSGIYDTCTYVGESLILYSGEYPYIFEKSGIK